MNKAIKKQIEKLNELPELQARYAEVVGEETRAPNKTFLIRRIVTALESHAAREEAAEATAAPAKTKKAKKLKTAVEDQDGNESESSEQKNELSVEQLRERYHEVVGRDTASHDSRYLRWKIRQAEQGKIPVGPTRTRRGDGVERDFKVLPVRMEADLVERLDEAWQRQGLKSRMELFRVSLSKYMTSIGEDEVAQLLSM
jgi:hypothetical protein